MSFRVVLDTNVVFEGLTKQAGLCGVIIEAWRHQLFDVFVTDALTYEYEEVLIRQLSEHRWKKIQPLFAELLVMTTYIAPYFTWKPSSPDRDDEMVIDCVMNANAILITSNIRDFKLAQSTLGMSVMTPEAFVQLFLED